MTSFNCKADGEAVLCPGDKDVSLVLHSNLNHTQYPTGKWWHSTSHFGTAKNQADAEGSFIFSKRSQPS